MPPTRVLVTGGSGFIGSHTILQLLEAGHEVRTTVRRATRESDVRALLAAGDATSLDRLSFAVADLEDDRGWADAVARCEYVLHVASPLPPGAPKHEDELIIPARDGTLRVLRAAREAGVKRVVLTSSFAAIGYGHPRQDTPFDETRWTNLDAPVSAYVKSKTLAERAAWDFIAKDGGALELSVVNPTGVLGPVLGRDYSSSIGIVQRMLDGALPGCPRLYFGLVDVRDVADLHLRAMTHPAAKGERFIAISGEVASVLDVATMLRRRMGALAEKAPTRELPDWLVRIGSWFDPGLRQFVSELGKRKRATGEKACRILGWNPRPGEDAVVATAESLARLGLVKAR